MSTLTEAREFCVRAHDGQKRKYTGDPYHTHCEAVERRVSCFTDDVDVRIAALLHDTLEDTAVTFNEIAAKFGARVADLVLELTDHYTHQSYPHLNRVQRKALERGRLAKASDAAKLIKFCDLADNTASIEKHDPGFAKVYLPERDALLDAMAKG